MLVSFKTILSALGLTYPLCNADDVPSDRAMAIAERVLGPHCCPVVADSVLRHGGEFLEVSDEYPEELDQAFLYMAKCNGACVLPLRYPERYTYAAGFARFRMAGGDELVPHVWNLDADGRVVELFPRERKTVYYGVPVPHTALLAFHRYAARRGEFTPYVVNAEGRALLRGMGTDLDALLGAPPALA